MKHNTSFKFLSLFYTVILSLSLFKTVLADDETIPANGQLCVQGTCYQIEITFPPKGGQVSGSLSGTKSQDGCTLDSNGIIDGSFSGGDGGEISGSIDWTMVASCNGGSTSKTWAGTWQGTIYADGSGNGSGSVQGVGADWTLSFSSEDFNRILTPITKDYFKSTYGIDVVDGTAKWTDDQLQILDTVIRRLPADFWKKCKVTKFVRDSVSVISGIEEPKVMGTYFPTERTIRMYDNSNNPSYFLEDKTGDKDFTGTLVHEITHSYQSYLDYKSIQTDSGMARCPLIKDFRIET